MSVARYVAAVPVVAMLILTVVVTAAATTYVVSPNGLGDYPTIQAAVDAAIDGDTIELTDGTFTGDGNRDIVVPAKNIVIRSQSGEPVQCMIDCEGTSRSFHRGFHFTSTGTGTASLIGVAVMNGYTDTSGGGIWIEGASPQIEDCAAAGCTVDGSSKRGGGLYVDALGSPTILNCIFTGNTADYGGGMAVGSGGGLIEGCMINDNTATNTAAGIYVSASLTLEIRDCEISSNSGWRAGGVRLSGSSSSLTDCVIVRNEAEWSHSGGLWLQGGTVTGCTIVDNSSYSEGGNVTCFAGTGTLENCIVAFSETGDGIYADDGQEPTIVCCDVYGNAGDDYGGFLTDQTGINGNISEDPQLCWMEVADYQLFDTSPCLPGANDCVVLMGALGQGCDSPVDERSWGTIKAMYR